MKTVYYLPFDAKASLLLNPGLLKEVKLTSEKFKEEFLSDQPDITVIPSFNGKEGFEVLPLNN